MGIVYRSLNFSSFIIKNLPICPCGSRVGYHKPLKFQQFQYIFPHYYTPTLGHIINWHRCAYITFGASRPFKGQALKHSLDEYNKEHTLHEVRGEIVTMLNTLFIFYCLY